MLKDKESFKKAYLEKFLEMHGKDLEEGTNLDKYKALAGLIRDLISPFHVITNKSYQDGNKKQVYYFSIEFLIGKLLRTYLINLGIKELVVDGLSDLNIDFFDLEKAEPDAGLGNGGLGRLAACFLDSMASLGIPGHGNGIRYKYGLFEQKIVDGYQVELPDNWLKNGYDWEFRKPDKSVVVKFKGKVSVKTINGKTYFVHEDFEPVLAVPYDIPIVGFDNTNINTLRLWSAESVKQEFDLPSFNRGEYLKAVEYKYSVEAISQILYPDDSSNEGKLLRLKQQYFFVSAGLQSIVRRYKKYNNSFKDFPEKIAIHINDTHPALCIPELMRILIDEEGLGWDEAWNITINTCSFTNHTILPEALEKWPVDLFKSLLPRIYMIIEEINERFTRSLWGKYPGDWDKISRMAIISYDYIHMTHLAIVGSYSVNGVAKIHTKILKTEVMKDFYETYPYKFNNKTNGITHRRFLLKANPELATLITESIGPGWIKQPKVLLNLLNFRDDPVFREKITKVKQYNKSVLADYIDKKYQIFIDTSSIFDIQVKRIHGYKRQLLNVLHIIDLHNRLKENPNLDIHPRTFIFGGKAAPGYYFAKCIIKLINTLAQKVNKDPTVNEKIKVVFLENFNVSLAEMIYPAADVSEQISTASKEASGTGNMKFMMNGAITIGTLDGANIEIRNEIGDENMFIFGLTADQVLDYYQDGRYNAWDEYNNDPRIKKILEQLNNSLFHEEAGEFRSIYEALLYDNDEFFVLKDFSFYVDAQSRLDEKYRDKKRWAKMAITNIAHSGKFSSDRTIREYTKDIWKIKPILKSD